MFLSLSYSARTAAPPGDVVQMSFTIWGKSFNWIKSNCETQYQIEEKRTWKDLQLANVFVFWPVYVKLNWRNMEFGFNQGVFQEDLLKCDLNHAKVQTSIW